MSPETGPPLYVRLAVVLNTSPLPPELWIIRKLPL